MAIVIPSGLISEIRGKVGGSIFQRSKAGIILRKNTIPVNKRSNLQNTARSISANVLQAWFGLSNAQRIIWDRFKQYLPVQQKNFNTLFLTAQQTFIKFNSYRLHYSLPILETPKFNKCAVSPITLSITSNGVAITLVTSRTMVPANEFIVLFMTIVFPSSVNNPGSRYKLIKFETTATDTYNITALYTAIFGQVPAAGTVVFVKYTNVSKLSGYPFPFSFEKITL